jgi:hypothetical protein
MSRLNSKKLNKSLTPVSKRPNHLWSTYLESDFKTTNITQRKGYLLHPLFPSYTHTMLNNSLHLIGPSMSPYKYSITNQVLHKIKSLLTLESEDLLGCIIRLPSATTQTPQPRFYSSFLQTLSDYSIKQQTKILSTLCKHHNKNRILKYKTMFKNSRSLVRLKKQVRPYLFLNTFQYSKSFLNKTTLHKFLKFTTSTRFAKRQKLKSFFRKKSLLKTHRRTLKNVSTLQTKLSYTKPLIHKYSVLLLPTNNNTKLRFIPAKYNKKKKKQLLIRKKNSSKINWRSGVSWSYLYSLRRKVLLVGRKRRKNKSKRKFIKRFLVSFQKQKKTRMYTLNTLKLKHKLRYKQFYRSLLIQRGNFSNRKGVNLKYTDSLSVALKLLFRRFLERIVNPSFIYNSASKNNALKLFTKTKKSFRLQNVGVFILNNTRLFKLQYRFKFRFKKLYFSFLFPNQLKKSLMDKKKRIIISRFFLRRRLKTFNSLKFSFKTFKKKFKSFYNLKFFNTQEVGNPNSSIHFYKNSAYDILYRNDYLSKGIDFSSKIQEVFIRRIRFKPGYQRIWRQARTSIKEALSLKFKYQYRLTRYLTKFFRQTTHYMLSFSEISLEKTLMYSRLLPDVNALVTFIDSKLIYINGFCAWNTHVPVVKNDLVQLVISNWYYALYRWLLNWSIIRIKKFKRLVYRKGLASKHRLMKTRKQKSRYTPNWIHNVRYDMSDVKNYLEVDYFTLSVFVIYEPFILNHQFINDLPQTRPNIFKLYNWKYIT